MAQFSGALKATAGAAVLATVLAAGGAASAQVMRRAEILERLAACRADADAASRLACYDRVAGELDQAERSGQVVVMDRAQVQDAKRRTFGLQLPNFDLFERGPETEQVQNVVLTIERAQRAADGKWIFTMTDGQVWRMIDGRDPVPSPRAGQTIEIRRASLGSFMGVLQGQRAAIRVRRER